MKLIDILVRELPKLGGWPDGVDDIEMLSDGTIYFNGDIAPSNYKLALPQCSDGWSRLKSAKDYSNAVTRWQYEAALAASKPEWDGEGLPPVGCECEYKDTGTGEWIPVEIKYSSSQIVVFSGRIRFRESAVEISKDVVLDNPQFRPIRSEADKKRDEAVKDFVRQLIECVDLHAMDKRRDDFLREKLYSMLPTLPGVTVID